MELISENNNKSKEIRKTIIQNKSEEMSNHQTMSLKRAMLEMASVNLCEALTERLLLLKTSTVSL